MDMPDFAVPMAQAELVLIWLACGERFGDVGLHRCQIVGVDRVEICFERPAPGIP
jgi:hypothetical protein